MSRVLALLITLLLLCSAPTAAHAALRVTQSGGADNRTGEDWQSALSADDMANMLQGRVIQGSLRGGQEFWLAEGVYSNDNLQPGTQILGGFSGVETKKEQRDPSKNTTILVQPVFAPVTLQPPDGPPKTVYPDSTTIIDGCQIQPGFTGAGVISVALADGQQPHPQVNNCRIFGGTIGGIQVRDSFLDVDSCTIISATGVGVSLEGTKSNVFISRCQIDHNEEAGIWIFGGGAATIQNCKIEENGLKYGARRALKDFGGIVVDQHFTADQVNPLGVRIEKCDIEHNWGPGGNGLSVATVKHAETGVTVVDTIISGNGDAQGKENMPSPPEQGGGVYCLTVDPLKPDLIAFTNCQITGNIANLEGGGLWISGPGVLMSRCTISGNVAGSPVFHGGNGGGAFFNGDQSDSTEYHATLRDCLLTNNRANENGGALYFESSDPWVINCTIVSNSALAHGGGIFTDSNRTDFSYHPDQQRFGLVANCALFLNDAPIGAALCHYNGSLPSNSNPPLPPDIQHCAYGVGDDFSLLDLNDTESALPLPASNVRLQDAGFAGGGDFHPLPSSGLIDKGSNQYVLQGETDLDNGPRVLGPSVDIGAYEKQAASAKIVLASLTLTLGAYDKRRKFYPITGRVELRNDGPNDAHNVSVKTLTAVSGTPMNFNVASVKANFPAAGSTIPVGKIAVVTFAMTPAGSIAANTDCNATFTVGGTYDATGGPAPFTVTTQEVLPSSVSVTFRATPLTLTPANGRMVTVTLTYLATALGDCPGPITYDVSVGTLAGVPREDFIITDAHHVSLRAANSDPAHPRTYTVFLDVKLNGVKVDSKSITIKVAKTKAH